MKNLNAFLHKNVIIVDSNKKEWKGYVEKYNDDDSFLDYEGESIDVRVEGSPDEIVCFGKSEIKYIKST